MAEEVYVSDPNLEAKIRSEKEDRVRVKRKTLEAVLEQCQRALQLLNDASSSSSSANSDDERQHDSDSDIPTPPDAAPRSGSLTPDSEADEVIIIIIIIIIIVDDLLRA